MTRRTFLPVLFALRKGKIDEAIQLLERAMQSGAVTKAALYVRQGKQTRKLNAELPFLLASITKPMTCAGVMILVNRGMLSLDDRVSKHIPEFAGGDRGLVTVKHLVTHTSGLPDMLPDNDALRKRHAPLSDFVAGACKTPLLFRPGSQVKYQSMGILLAAEVTQRITKTPLRRFLAKEVFTPLGMTRTALGLGRFKIADTARNQVDADPDWNWNSEYWRNLGAPWGGAHATAADVARFLDCFVHQDDRVLPAAVKRQMIVNQSGLAEPWGIGWAVGKGKFGRACGPAAFGHSGSTGTLCWADPGTDTVCAILSTKPADQSNQTLLKPVSDLVSEAAD